MKKYRIVALLGKSAAGKDTILNAAVNKREYFNKIVSHTTRPPRDYERDGIDYHFVDVADFTRKVLCGKMVEACSFKENFYGICFDSLDIDKLNIGIFNLDGILTLEDDPMFEVHTAYVDADDKIRLIRALDREGSSLDCSEVCRRFLADEKDFEEKLDDITSLKVYLYNYMNLLKPVDDLLEYTDWLNEQI